MNLNLELLDFIKKASLEERLIIISMFLNNGIDESVPQQQHPSTSFILSQNPFDGTSALPGVVYKSNKCKKA